MQSTLTAGDTLNLIISVADYPASAGWVLKYRLVPRTGTNSAISITASASGNDYLVLVAAATTAGWAADSYSWTSWVEKAGEVYSVDSGQIVIKPDPRTAAAGTDGRSQAHKALDDARAALAAWSPTRRRYRIGDREMEFNAVSEIVAMIGHWEREVQRELRAAAMEAGRGSKRGKVFVRMGRG